MDDILRAFLNQSYSFENVGNVVYAPLLSHTQFLGSLNIALIINKTSNFYKSLQKPTTFKSTRPAGVFCKNSMKRWVSKPSDLPARTPIGAPGPLC